jgi:DNA polymerase-3 subunit gamma/tau
VPTAVGARWAELVGLMHTAGRIGAMVRELAMQAQCVTLDEQSRPAVCRLRVERENLRAPALAEKLRAALADTLHGAVELALEPGVAQDSPAQRDAAQRAQRLADAERVIRDDPVVQALMAQYKTARIVPGSVKPQG